jgi:hypothetical protein
MLPPDNPKPLLISNKDIYRLSQQSTSITEDTKRGGVSKKKQHLKLRCFDAH